MQNLKQLMFVICFSCRCKTGYTDLDGKLHEHYNYA